MKKLPPWIKKQSTSKNSPTITLIKNLGTEIPNCICNEAKCPNRGECFEKKQLTFLILGTTCTRNCAFCNVKPGTPEMPNKKEFDYIDHAIQKLSLKFVVITSPTRDDLPDGGAAHYAFIIKKIKAKHKKIKIEVLIPDFQGNNAALNTVLNAKPDVLNHNLETIPKLYDSIRNGADYQQSLTLLKQAKSAQSLTKTGLMVGLGETKADLKKTFQDIKAANVDILTIGQYLQPSKKNIAVQKYYTPEEFDELKVMAKNIGIKTVFSGPLVRSSFMAEEILNQSKI